MINKYRFHPACLLFPPLPDEELRDLADDITANGQRDPVVRWHGKILDGRCRLLACEAAGVEPRFVEWDGKGSIVAFIITKNLPRRHLSSSQRAGIAIDLLTLLEQEAKERQRLSPGRGKKVAKKLATFSKNGNGKASQLAARLMKTNHSYIEKAKVINKLAPELLKEIRCGCLNIPDALIVAKLPKANRQRVVKIIRASGAEKLKEALKAERPTTHDGDKTPTPPELAQWVFEQVIKAGYRFRRVLDPCSGAGNLNAPFRRSGCEIIEYEIDRGKDFFQCHSHIDVDLVLANTPWRDGPDGERGGEVSIRWLQQIVAVVGKATPIIFFEPLHMLSPWIDSTYYRYQRSDDCPRLYNITPLPRGTFGLVDAPAAILWYNVPKVADVAVVPTEVFEAIKKTRSQGSLGAEKLR